MGQWQWDLYGVGHSQSSERGVWADVFRVDRVQGGNVPYMHVSLCMHPCCSWCCLCSLTCHAIGGMPAGVS